MRNRSRSKSLVEIKKRRNSEDGDMVEEGQEGGKNVRHRIREASRSRSKGYQR